MGKPLLVVESPTKSKTISKYLGDRFHVMASGGHVRDLPESGLAIDVENGFTPTYVTLDDRAHTLKQIAQAAVGASEIFLAPDPDREGEAIAWHLANAIHQYLSGDTKLIDAAVPMTPAQRKARMTRGAKPKGKGSRAKKPKPDALPIVNDPKLLAGGYGKFPKIHRVKFDEITPKGIKLGMDHPSLIDMDLVNAQQARRVVDRLVGYKVSPILWKTLQPGLSAGRVQTVALRLIVEREIAIRGFVPVEYWSIHAHLRQEDKTFTAQLVKWEGKKVEIGTEAEATRIHNALKGQPVICSNVKQGKRQRKPGPPFTTSTLQQDANRRLGFPTWKTMQLAQQLYEGIDLGDGPVGLITYMRTDSVRVSTDALDAVRKYVKGAFGDAFLPETAIHYASRKSAQDAHEAIRPADVLHEPSQVARRLDADQLKLYKLIWERFVSSQMMPAEYATVQATFECAKGELKAAGQRLVFEGFLVLYGDVAETEEEQAARHMPDAEDEPQAILPKLEVGDQPEVRKLAPDQHFTEPPPRFNEGSLVRELEADGIGRPSTYAQIIRTLINRKYVTNAKKQLVPTDIGEAVNKILCENFPTLFEVGFTADMEAKLDLIEEKGNSWVETVGDFYRPFEIQLADVESRMGELRKSLDEMSEFVCEKCGSPMLIKWGRNGRFLACSAYPECKSTRPLEDETPEQSEKPCPKCGKLMLIRTNKNGKYYACPDSDCKTYAPITTGIKCPRCDKGELVRRVGRFGVFYGCSAYPECDFISKFEVEYVPCPACANPWMYKRNLKTLGDFLQCPECKHQELLGERSDEERAALAQRHAPSTERARGKAPSLHVARTVKTSPTRMAASGAAPKKVVAKKSVSKAATTKSAAKSTTKAAPKTAAKSVAKKASPAPKRAAAR